MAFRLAAAGRALGRSQTKRAPSSGRARSSGLSLQVPLRTRACVEGGCYLHFLSFPAMAWLPRLAEVPALLDGSPALRR